MDEVDDADVLEEGGQRQQEAQKDQRWTWQPDEFAENSDDSVVLLGRREREIKHQNTCNSFAVDFFKLFLADRVIQLELLVAQTNCFEGSTIDQNPAKGQSFIC